MSEKICKTCRFWKHPMEWEVSRFCYYNPPTIDLVVHFPGYQPETGLRPRTDRFDFCSKWEINEENEEGE